MSLQRRWLLEAFVLLCVAALSFASGLWSAQDLSFRRGRLFPFWLPLVYCAVLMVPTLRGLPGSWARVIGVVVGAIVTSTLATTMVVVLEPDLALELSMVWATGFHVLLCPPAFVLPCLLDPVLRASLRRSPGRSEP